MASIGAPLAPARLHTHLRTCALVSTPLARWPCQCKRGVEQDEKRRPGGWEDGRKEGVCEGIGDAGSEALLMDEGQAIASWGQGVHVRTGAHCAHCAHCQRTPVNGLTQRLAETSTLRSAVNNRR